MKKYILMLLIAHLVMMAARCKHRDHKNDLAPGLLLSPSQSGSNPVNINMIAVPGGIYQRDSVATNKSTVSSFHMSQTEITRGQFRAVVGYDPSDTSYSSSPGTDDPVQNVSWYEALVFCNKLSLSAGLTPVYSILVGGVPKTDPADWGPVPTSYNGTWTNVAWNSSANGYRLPAIMEWTWAAMGATADARAGDIISGVNTGGYSKGYAGSTEASTGIANEENYAWIYSNTPGSTSHPVGGRLPNELGLYDMTGNVSEWVWEGADYASPTGAVVDYHGPATTATADIAFAGYPFHQGGNWLFQSWGISPGYHEWFYFKYYVIGFRVVRK